LGDLKGNKFEIRLRDAVNCDKGSNSLAEEDFKVMKERAEKGAFVNYFGEQRVGLAGETFDVGYASLHVGRAIVRQEWEKALTYLCIGRRVINGRRVDLGNSEWASFRRMWIEKDERGHPVDFAKGEIGRGAKRRAENVSAENKKRTRTCFRTRCAFSVTTAINFHLSSKPFSQFASLIAALDLIGRVPKIQSQPEYTVLAAATKQRTQTPDYYEAFKKGMNYQDFNIQVRSFQSFVFNVAAGVRAGMGLKVQVGDLYREGEGREGVVIVTEDMLKGGKLSMDNVVLPLPGSNIILPTNAVKAIYDEWLEGVDWGDAGRNKSDNCFTYTKGTYRTVITQASDVKVDKEGRDLVFSFSLLKGSFATMFLREVLGKMEGGWGEGERVERESAKKLKVEGSRSSL